jgi:hypothetical protein
MRAESFVTSWSVLQTARIMARLTGLPRNVVVVVPRNGAPSAPRNLQAVAQQVLKKDHKTFEMQDPITGADLQDLVCTLARVVHLLEFEGMFSSLFDRKMPQIGMVCS